MQSSATLLTPPWNQQSKASPRLDPLPRTRGGAGEAGGTIPRTPCGKWPLFSGLPAAGTTTRPKADELGKMH